MTTLFAHDPDPMHGARGEAGREITTFGGALLGFIVVAFFAALLSRGHDAGGAAPASSLNVQQDAGPLFPPVVKALDSLLLPFAAAASVTGDGEVEAVAQAVAPASAARGVATSVLSVLALAALVVALAFDALRRGAMRANAWTLGALIASAPALWLASGSAVLTGLALLAGSALAATAYSEDRRPGLLLVATLACAGALGFAPVLVLALPWLCVRGWGSEGRPPLAHMLIPAAAAVACLGLVMTGAVGGGGASMDLGARLAAVVVGPPGGLSTAESGPPVLAALWSGAPGLLALAALSFGLLLFGRLRTVTEPLLLLIPFAAVLILRSNRGVPAEALLLPLGIGLGLLCARACALVDLLPRAGRLLHVLALSALVLQLAVFLDPEALRFEPRAWSQSTVLAAAKRPLPPESLIAYAPGEEAVEELASRTLSLAEIMETGTPSDADAELPASGSARKGLLELLQEARSSSGGAVWFTEAAVMWLARRAGTDVAPWVEAPPVVLELSGSRDWRLVRIRAEVLDALPAAEARAAGSTEPMQMEESAPAAAAEKGS